MIAQDLDSKAVAEDISMKQIKIKQTQLKIARESNMTFVAEVLQHQLEELQDESNFQAMMSLLDD
ncbi:hypothetical protein [Calothrix sp. PCC 6303]|uniref:hypothetical protein n=1 Tax=Calothrix sp. PCC 6303 TaxID=1170562 RepID=UPI0002A04B75|nr:hypothetical protein [Calothrix sp. PCC 6303]AFZ01921.1 hypothetical protein Cal6303_2972 [Calothrix sp. PCC 6303]